MGDTQDKASDQELNALLKELSSRQQGSSQTSLRIRAWKLTVKLSYGMKRMIDIFGSLVGMILLAPVFIAIGIAVKLSSPGPIIFTQIRVGCNGRHFKFYKFRSMRQDAEALKASLAQQNESKDGVIFKMKDDPRITKVGRFLRRTSLDELPQLWNVFRGDMSFIGYRPERQFYIDQIMEKNPRYQYLYQIRPGVTSYATLYNGYTDTLEKMLTRLDLDLYYLRNHSVWFDLRVLGLTFLRIVGGKKF